MELKCEICNKLFNFNCREGEEIYDYDKICEDCYNIKLPEGIIVFTANDLPPTIYGKYGKDVYSEMKELCKELSDLDKKE